MDGIGGGKHGRPGRHALVGQAEVHVVRGEQAKTAVMVFDVVPAEEDVAVGADILDRAEPRWEVRPALQRLELRLRRVVVGRRAAGCGSWSGSGLLIRPSTKAPSEPDAGGYWPDKFSGGVLLPRAERPTALSRDLPSLAATSIVPFSTLDSLEQPEARPWRPNPRSTNEAPTSCVRSAATSDHVSPRQSASVISVASRRPARERRSRSGLAPWSR